MKRASAVRLAQVIFLTCITCACGAKHGPAGNGYFPCSLLSAQEVSAALGEKVQQLQPLPPDKCRYLPDNPLDFITVKAAPSGALALFKGSNIAGHMMGVKPTGQSAGVGDESFWTLSVIWVRKGDAYMSINMAQAPVDQQQVGLRLARIAAARL